MEVNESRRFSAAVGGDVASRAGKAGGFARRGTISSDEFEDQKRKLLGD